MRKEAPGGSRPALVWDTKLEADAIKWATYLATTGTISHDMEAITNKLVGENVSYILHQPTYGGGGSIEPGPFLTATKVFCEEIEFYNGQVMTEKTMGTPGKRGQIGHYTQACVPSASFENVRCADDTDRMA